MVRPGQQALHATGQRQLVPTDVRGARRLIALRGVPRQQRVLVVPRRGSGVEGEVAHMGPRADGSGGVIGQGPGPRKEAVRIDQFGGAGEVEAAQALQAREGKITARFRDDLRLPRHVVQEEPPVGRAEPGLPAHQRLQIQGDRLHRPERLQRKLPDPLRHTRRAKPARGASPGSGGRDRGCCRGACGCRRCPPPVSRTQPPPAPPAPSRSPRRGLAPSGAGRAGAAGRQCRSVAGSPRRCSRRRWRCGRARG